MKKQKQKENLLVRNKFLLVSLFFLISCSGKVNIWSKIVEKTISFFSPNIGEISNPNLKVNISQVNPILLFSITNIDSIDFSKIDTVKDINEALKWEMFVYIDRGKQDPFIPLVTKGTSEKGLQVEVSELVGIIWGQNGYLALVKEIGGSGYVLREGDRVINGFVEKIDKESITFRLQQFEQVTKVVLHLKQKEGEK